MWKQPSTGGRGLETQCSAEVSLSQTESLPAAGLLFCSTDFPVEGQKVKWGSSFPVGIRKVSSSMVFSFM